MKKISLFIKYISICVVCLLSGGSLLAQPGWGGGGGATNLPLVAETDFSSSTKEAGAYFASVEEVDGFGQSVILPSVSTGLSLVKTTKSTETKSDFLSKVQYAVTPNPIRVDSFRFNDNKDSGEWGFIVSGGSTGAQSNQKMLSFDVFGVKNGGRYRVEIEICNPFDAGEVPAGYSAQVRVGVNNAATSNGSDQSGATSKISKGGNCTTITVNSPTTDQQEVRPIADNRLTVNLFIGQLQQSQAIMIKSIKVYAEVEPAIVGLSTVCAGGETSLLSADNTYIGCKMQWYRDGVQIAGADGTTYTHTSTKTLGADETKKYTYSYKVTTPNGDVFSSSNFVVTDKVCCIGDDGKRRPVS